jgi:pSer/pThr/pTyr-binding forkhead associated (FHA) protein
MSAGRLFWVQRDGGVVEVPLTKPRVILGRANDCDLRLPFPAVSSHHAVVVRGDKSVTVEDLRSTNGTRVNGRRVETLVLKHGDQIEVGAERLVFFTDSTMPPAQFSRLSQQMAAEGAPTQRRRPLEVPTPESRNVNPPTKPRFDKPPADPPTMVASSNVRATTKSFRGFVTLLNGSASGKRFPLTKSVTTLGQEGLQVFQIVLREEGYWVVRGPNSTAPFVNGVTVDDARGLLLAHNDVIELVGATVRFETEAN